MAPSENLSSNLISRPDLPQGGVSALGKQEGNIALLHSSNY